MGIRHLAVAPLKKNAESYYIFTHELPHIRLAKVTKHTLTLDN